MKHSLSRYCLIVALLFLSTKAFNQACTFVSPLVQVLGSKDSSGFCVRTVALTVDINVNGGNKWTYIHLWTTPTWHTSAPSFNYSSAPTNANILSNDLLTLALNYSGAPVLSATYPPDAAENPKVQSAANGVTFTQTPSVANPGATTFTFTNVRIVTAGACDPALTFKGDSWSSQSNNGKTVQCSLQGFVFASSDPTVQGAVYCGVTHHVLNFAVTANGAGNQIAFQFDVYAHTSASSNFDINNDTKIYTGSTTYNVANPAVAGKPQVLNFTSSTTPPAGYISIPAIYPATWSDAPNTANQSKDLYIVLRNIVIVNGNTTTNVANALATQVSHNCAGPLAATFNNVNASYNNGKLTVDWQTLQEINCKKFLVEGSADGNNWVTLGEITSKASDGNSNDVLSYEFTGSVPVALAGLFFTALLLPLFRSRIARIVVVVAFLGFLGSCMKGKKDVNANDMKSMYIRITQINNDGSYGTVSKVIKVIK